MPEFISYKDHELTSGGGTINFTNRNVDSKYRLYTSGSITLTSSWTIQLDPNETSYSYTLFTVRYEADIDLNGNSITFFGTTMPEELSDKNCFIYAKYDGSVWNVIFWPDWEEDNIITNAHLQTDSVNTNEVTDDSINIAKLDSSEYSQGAVVVGNSSGDPSVLSAGSGGNILIIDGNGDIVWSSMTGDVNIDSSGSTTIQSDTITVSKIPDDEIRPNKLNKRTRTELVTLDVSFETDEVGDYKIVMPYKGQVNTISAYVTKAIEATDDATITPKDDNSTDMGSGQITLTAGSSIGTGASSTPTSNNTFSSGDVLTFTTAKTTKGGKAVLSIEVERLAG